MEPDFSLLVAAAHAGKLPRCVTLWPGVKMREVRNVDAAAVVIEQAAALADTGPQGLAAAEVLKEVYRVVWG